MSLLTQSLCDCAVPLPALQLCINTEISPQKFPKAFLSGWSCCLHSGGVFEGHRHVPTHTNPHQTSLALLMWLSKNSSRSKGGHCPSVHDSSSTKCPTTGTEKPHFTNKFHLQNIQDLWKARGRILIQTSSAWQQSWKLIDLEMCVWAIKKRAIFKWKILLSFLIVAKLRSVHSVDLEQFYSGVVWGKMSLPVRAQVLLMGVVI